MKFMRCSRLTRPADYRFVFARPEITRDRNFKVLSRASDRGYCRLGLAVSRKVCRKAVDRNRLKRLIRESFRAHQEEIAENVGFDIVVLPSARAASICNSELRGSLQTHWQKIEKKAPVKTGEPARKQH